MGRYYYSKKEEADTLKQLNVVFLNRHNYFQGGYYSGTITWSRNGEKTGSISILSFVGENEKYVRLIYTQTDRFTDEKKDFDYKVSLATTPCNFGGNRYWFVCSASRGGKYCGRRVGTLYKDGDYFACRHCYNLSYSSRNLGGIFKSAGQVVSEPELEELYMSIKTKYYKGKMTKRYKRYLQKERRANMQMFIVARGLGVEV